MMYKIKTQTSETPAYSLDSSVHRTAVSLLNPESSFHSGPGLSNVRDLTSELSQRFHSESLRVQRQKVCDNKNNMCSKLFYHKRKLQQERWLKSWMFLFCLFCSIFFFFEEDLECYRVIDYRLQMKPWWTLVHLDCLFIIK